MGDLTRFKRCSVGLAGMIGELTLMDGMAARNGLLYPALIVAGEFASEPVRRGRRGTGAGMGSVVRSAMSSASASSSSVVPESDGLDGLPERDDGGEREAGAGRWNRSCGSGWLESPVRSVEARASAPLAVLADNGMPPGVDIAKEQRLHTCKDVLRPDTSLIHAAPDSPLVTARCES